MLLFNSKALLSQWKRHDAAVNFDAYLNLQRHRVVLPVIARHLVRNNLYYNSSSSKLNVSAFITEWRRYMAVWCSIVLNRRQRRNDPQGRRRRELWWRTLGLQSCCSSWLSSSSSRSCQHFSWRYVWFPTTSSSSTSTSPTTWPTLSSTLSWTRYIHDVPAHLQLYTVYSLLVLSCISYYWQ